jgi:hypothetical protein
MGGDRTCTYLCPVTRPFQHHLVQRSNRCRTSVRAERDICSFCERTFDDQSRLALPSGLLADITLQKTDSERSAGVQTEKPAMTAGLLFTAISILRAIRFVDLSEKRETINLLKSGGLPAADCNFNLIPGEKFVFDPQAARRYCKSTGQAPRS